MRIFVINPNTSASMTAHLARVLETAKGPSTELVVTNPVDGPRSIESALDEAQAIPHTLGLVENAARDGFDAIVIACFSDPGLQAAREVVAIPVVGIEESGLHVAAMLGHRFSVLTARRQRVPAKIEHVRGLGLESRLASVRPLEMSVLEMDADPLCAKSRILDVGRTAVDEDGAEVLVLGCAGLAGYSQELTAALGVTILDPAPVALKMAELLVDLQLTHCKRGLYASPASRLPRLAPEREVTVAPGRAV
jgi:allantoin racemase